MNFPKEVKIVEVGPRDGLQNEPIIIPTPLKIDLINQLVHTGLNTVEVTSFVSPKWIPQLSDGEMVFSNIKKYPHVHYSVLVPNKTGLERALKVEAKEIAILCAASETFSQKNTRCSIEESFVKNQEVTQLAINHHLTVRGYISCSLGCPYEGKISPKTVAKIASRLLAIGCSEISIGDTIGIATPYQAQNLIKMIAQDIPVKQLAIHFHDTYGQALANIYACLEAGVRIIDSSISGLGGCPYAKGASGNVATEDVVYMLEGLGIKTGIDLEALVAVSKFCTKITGHSPRSKVAQAKLGI